jgi:hypothetical protein
MKRKKIFMIVAVIAVIVTLGGTTAAGFVKANKYKTNLEYNYKRAMSDLSSCVSNIQTTLNKAVYANTPTQQNGLAAKLMRETSMAKAALAVLPIKDNSVDNITKFITQVGDFSMSMSNKISSGQKITAEEYNIMKGLEEYAKTLQAGFQDIKGDIDYEKLSEKFTKSAEDFTNFPSLIYDGPFSDHIGQKKPRLTQGKGTIPQGNAQNIAADFLNTTQDSITHTQDTAGGLPTYNFTGNDGRIRISVTKEGGFVSTMDNSRSVTEEKLKHEEAFTIAQNFLKSRGLMNMKESYYIISDGICTINFAYYKNDIIFYPDLIKVSVALDDGEIVRFNATGYIMNHYDRNVTAKISADAAQLSVSPKLKVKKRELALIPTPGLSEVLCYEFLCDGSSNDRVLVYINATTGYEEQILILESTDNGVLTQ